MKQIIWWIIPIILLGLALYSVLSKTKEPEIPEETIEKIEHLESKVDSIYIVRDSIYERVDTIYVKIKNNDKQYEETRNTILSNDLNEDYRFFREYIDLQRNRLDSISIGC